MKRSFGSYVSAAAIAAVFAGSICSSLVMAQQPGGPGPQNGPGGQFPGGPFPGQGPGQGMPMMGPRQIDSLDIPAPILQQALALSDEQTMKIDAIQRMIHAQRGPGGPGDPRFGGPRGGGIGPGVQSGNGGAPNGQFGGPGNQGGAPGGPGFQGPGGQGGNPGGQFGGQGGQRAPSGPGDPRFGGQGGGPGFGGPGGQGAPGGQFNGQGASPEQQAIKGIYALLNATQKKLLPTILKQFDAFQMAGIPLEVVGPLKITNAQREKIASIVEAAQQAIRNAMEEARASGEFKSVGEVMQKSFEAVHQKTMAALNDSQKKGLADWINSHSQGGPGFGPQPGGPGDGNGPPPPQ